MNDQFDMFREVSNPLDSVEEILNAHEWMFSRTNEDELFVQVSGKAGSSFSMYFNWQEEFSAMQFHCQYDAPVARENMTNAAQALLRINAGLWLGYFDLDALSRIPSFRHTSLFRGMTQSSGLEHIEDLVDIALSECERYEPVFRLLSGPGEADAAALSLAVMDTAGES